MMKSLSYIGSALFIVIATGLVAYVVFFAPRLMINAPTGSTIIVYGESSQTPTTKTTASTPISNIRLKAGQYRVTITSGPYQQTSYATIAAFRPASLSFSPTTQPTVHLIGHSVAYNPVPDGQGGVVSLDTTNRVLDDIAANGTVSVLGGSQASGFFSGTGEGGVESSLYPILGGRAIVIINSQLYVLAQNNLQLLNMAGLPTDFTSLTIGASPLEQSFVVAANNSLYFYSSPTAAPQKVLDLNHTADVLALGGDKVIAYSTRMPVASGDETAYSDLAIDPILVDLTHKTQHTLASGPIASASVSPDGTLALVQSLASANTMRLYGLPTGNTLFSVDSSTILTPVWTNSSTYVYARGNEVWLMDTTSKTARLVTTIGTTGDITSMTYTPSSHTFYATTYSSDADASVYTFTLNPGLM